MKFLVYLLAIPILFAGDFASAKTHTVVIEAMQYTPSDLQVQTGDVVEWVNKDFFPHTATSPKNFDSGVIASNALWKFTVKTKGTFSYICSLHPTMKASLTVR